MSTGDYGVEIDVQTRIRDFDGMGHVNNAVYLTYLELARDEYVKRVVGESLGDIGAALVNLDIDFRAEIGSGEDVTVAVSAQELGTSSMVLEYQVRADGEPAATAETTVVAFDREAGEAKPLPEDWREAITDFEGL
jgi:acyl-CoA thioester hydrolase